MRLKTFYCAKARKMGFLSELDAKMALSRRIWADKGERREYPCYAGGKKHFHLTSQEKRNAA